MQPSPKANGKSKVSNEGGEEVQFRMAQLVAPHNRTPRPQRHTRTRKQAPRPRAPPRRITHAPCPPPPRQLARPEILASRIGQRTRQLGQADADAGANEGKEDEAVDDLDWAAAVDTGDEGRADAPPGVGEGEADTEEGEARVIAFEGGVVAHLGEGQGVGICGRGGGGFEGGFLVGHGGGMRGSCVGLEGEFFGGHGDGMLWVWASLLWRELLPVRL